MFNPSIGTFMGPDPAEADLNTYRYCGNQPTMATDPTGRQPIQKGRAISVAEEQDSGAFATNQDKTPSSPISIERGDRGALPFIRENNLKSNQDTKSMGGKDFNTNPWLSRGGPNQKVGATFPLGLNGSVVSLEWVITFNGKPYNATWGRRILKWQDSFLTANGSVQIPAGAKWEDDTDHENEYISGNKVYMYDGPGSPMGASPKFLFQVWAQGSDASRLEKWYYVDPNSGDFYGIDKPATEPPPPPKEHWRLPQFPQLLPDPPEWLHNWWRFIYPTPWVK
jgi:hypothetical protein